MKEKMLAIFLVIWIERFFSLHFDFLQCDVMTITTLFTYFSLSTIPRNTKAFQIVRSMGILLDICWNYSSPSALNTHEN